MDPLAEATTYVTVYHYCLNNPLSNIDPTGMWTETATGWSTNDPQEISEFMMNIQGGQNKEEDTQKKYEKSYPTSFSDLLNKFFDSINPFSVPIGSSYNAERVKREKKLENVVLTLETTNGILSIIVPGSSAAEVIAKVENGQGMAALAAIPFVVLDFVPAEKAASTIIKSVVKYDSRLLKLAREAFAGNDVLRREANALINELSKGNMDPGIGTKSIPNAKGIYEARSRGGARVYFRNDANGAVQIVGYSNKDKGNQQNVINRLVELY